MNSAEVTRTETADQIIYTMVIDGQAVSHLDISREHRIVDNVETADDHTRSGYATALWEHANAEAQCFHALDHHRTAEGDAFAEAVGGDTIDDEAGHVDVCCICTGDMED